MKRVLVLLSMCAMAMSIACSGDDAKDAADTVGDVAAQAEKGAHDAMNHAAGTAKEAAGTMAGTAVTACRRFAESGQWGEALEACKQAHEMMPDDLALEHAYQQAMAAAAE